MGLKNGSVINEIFWIRTLACLAVVLVHSVNTTLDNYEHSITQTEEYLLIALRFAAFFGTPAFIFISEVLLAHAYPNQVPKDFFKKRIKFLLVPFAFMAVVFALVLSDSFMGFWEEVLFNLFLGGYTGYFILIIFQFYLLHVLLTKHLRKWNPKKVLFWAFIINTAYLGLFHFTEPAAVPLGEYIWLRGHWVPFIGWIFYFVLGYYCGRNFELLKNKIQKHKKIIFIWPTAAFLAMVVLVRGDIIDVVSSKRIDNLVYTTGVIFFIILLTMKARKVPWFVSLISRHSFHIYLVHTLFLYYLPPIEGVNPLVYFLLAAVYCVLSSIITAKILLSLSSVSNLLIGKTIVTPQDLRKANQGTS
ncbi:acyltransferase family protein [Thalassorhabdus alkalitolerans]|uniref:Acyltransferase family protein n=1 Tax=Thalassorhabdus alkalitolerans TaxID=2282697 RepID=A0ABW0YIQ4_9BACI